MEEFRIKLNDFMNSLSNEEISKIKSDPNWRIKLFEALINEKHNFFTEQKIN